MSCTTAQVDMRVSNNGTWSDAFQFGDPTDTSWSFAGQHFIMEVKADKYDTTPLLTLSTDSNTIVVDSINQRVLHFNVTDTALAVLPPAEYVYDLVMYDESDPPIRVPLMQGRIYIHQGITQE